MTRSEWKSVARITARLLFLVVGVACIVFSGFELLANHDAFRCAAFWSFGYVLLDWGALLTAKTKREGA